jgi:hypothetical protein
LSAPHVHKHLREDSAKIPIPLIFIPVVQKLFALSTILLEDLNGQYFPGDPSLYRGKRWIVMSHDDNKSVFDNERVFRTNKERSVVGGKEIANRICRE